MEILQQLPKTHLRITWIKTKHFRGPQSSESHPALAGMTAVHADFIPQQATAGHSKDKGDFVGVKLGMQGGEVILDYQGGYRRESRG